MHNLKIIFLFSFAPVNRNRGLFLLEKGIEIAKKCALHNKIEAFFGKKCGIFLLKRDLCYRHTTKRKIIFSLCAQKVGISFQNDTSIMGGICSYCILKATNKPHFLP